MVNVGEEDWSLDCNLEVSNCLPSSVHPDKDFSTMEEEMGGSRVVLHCKVAEF